MNNISVISVGGTFEKEYYRGTGIINYTFGNKSKAEEIFKRIGLNNTKIYYPQNLVKDSTEITEKDRRDLLVIINKQVGPVIVIHGTDTMVITAKYLSDFLNNRLVILTGASTPWINKDSDAEFNLGGAVALAQTDMKGVFIFMNGVLFSADNCIKNKHGIFEVKHDK